MTLLHAVSILVTNCNYLPVRVRHDSEGRLYVLINSAVLIHGFVGVQNIQDEKGCPTDDEEHDNSHQHLDYLCRATYQQQKNTYLNCTLSTSL